MLGTAWGQDIINSSPSPVGSGARALGMGGAFIAIADDATSASWNPGGLTQLERPELSLVYSWKFFEEDFDDTFYIFSLKDTHNIEIQDVNYASFVYPFRRTIGGRNFVLSLNYQRKLDFDRALDLRARDIVPPFPFLDAAFNIKYRQEGGLGALSPALGFEITNKLSAGIVANIWDSDILSNNRWKTRNQFRLRASVEGSPALISAGEIAEDFTDYHGTNYTLGLLYKPNDRWSFGLVHHTKYTATVDYKKITKSRFPAVFTSVELGHLKFEWPAATGAGVAYRFPNDKLTLSADITYIDWDDYVKINPHKGLTERRVSPVTNLPKRLSPHDPTWTVRLGMEYVFVDNTKPVQNYLPSIRAGIFYDPEPASGRKDTFFGPRKGDGDPDDYYGFALGGGVLIKNRVNIDAAYQFRWGKGVKRDTFAGAFPFEIGFSEDVYQHLFYLSTVVYF